MIQVISGPHTWTFKEPEDHSLTKIFNNGRFLNVGTKIGLNLSRPLSVITDWPTILSIIVGKQVTIHNLGIGDFDIIVSDESTLGGNEMNLVGYLTKYDTRGLIHAI